jgi:hypothetical protein
MFALYKFTQTRTLNPNFADQPTAGSLRPLQLLNFLHPTGRHTNPETFLRSS